MLDRYGASGEYVSESEQQSWAQRQQQITMQQQQQRQLMEQRRKAMELVATRPQPAPPRIPRSSPNAPQRKALPVPGLQSQTSMPAPAPFTARPSPPSKRAPKPPGLGGAPRKPSVVPVAAPGSSAVRCRANQCFDFFVLFRQLFFFY